MDLLAKVLSFLVDMVLPLVAGYLLAKKAGLKAESLDRLMVAAILLVAPLLGLLSCWVMELELRLIWLPVFGVVMQVVPGVLGFVWARRKFDNALEKGSYVLSAMLSNRGFVGAFSVYILLDEAAYGYSRLVMLLAPIVVYGFCFSLARHFHSLHYAGEGERRSVLSVLLDRNQVPLVGVAAGFVLNFAHVERPAVCDSVFPWLVHILAWMVLLPVGVSLDFSEMRGYWRPVADLVPLKFVVTPLVIYALAWAAGLSGEMMTTVVVMSASPAAINAVIVSKLSDLNVHVAVAAVVLTTAFYLLVVFPLMLVVMFVWHPM